MRVFDTGRIYYLSRPVEILLEVLLAPLTLYVVLGTVFFGNVLHPSNIGLKQTIFYLCPLILLYVARFFSKVKDFFETLIISIRRYIFQSLYLRYRQINSTFFRELISLFISVPAPLLKLDHQTQDIAIERIIDSLKETNPKNRNLFLIEGSSGSGKTTLINLLFVRILLDKKVYRNAGSIFFFDFAKSKECQNKFIRSYNLGKYKNKLVVIDNFENIDRHNIGEFTKAILAAKKDDCEKVLIIVSREIRLLSISNDFDISLFRRIKAMGNHLRLDCWSRRSIEHTLTINSVLNDAMYDLHFARVFLKSKPSQFEKDLVEIENRNKFDSVLIRLIALVSALSIHKGYFSKKDYRKAVKTIVSNNCIIGFFERYIFMSYLNKLRRAGFVLKVITGESNFVFHDKLSKIYKAKYYDSFHEFKMAFNSVLEFRLKQAKENRDFVLAWLYFTELGKSDLSLFDQALCSGSPALMLENVSRVFEDGKRGFFYRELGILCELVGDFENANAYFDKSRAQMKNQKDLAFLKFERFEMEHGKTELSHQFASLTKDWLEKLTTTERGLLHFLAKFWIIHLDCHLGVFRPKEMMKLCELIVANFKGLSSESTYKTVHLLRRAYFDIFRLYFLQGLAKKDLIEKTFSHPAANIINKNYSIFSSYRLKNDAMYIHYSYIFYRGVFNTIPEDYPAKVLGSLTKEGGIAHARETAINLYKKAIDELEIFGDKASKSIDLRLQELYLMGETPNFDKIETSMNKYLDYAKESQLPDFIGNAHTFLAKLHILKCLSTEKGDYLQFLEIAQNRIHLAGLEYEKNGNFYGQTRARWFEILIDLKKNKNKNKFILSVNKFKELCRLKGYFREKELASKTISNGGLSPLELKNIIRYYPIVIQ